jgi:hypothetical protein
MMNDSLYRGFLGTCLGTGSAPPATPSRFPEWNWDRLVQAAADEAILAAMHDSLNGVGVTHEFPTEVSNLFLTVKQLNQERNEQILADLKCISCALNKVGIEPVVLKGAAYLVSGIYPNLSTRYLADLDLLLDESHFPAALEIFRSQGYFCEVAHPVETLIGNAYPPLCRAHSVEIDLHRSLCMGVRKSLLPTSEVLSKSLLKQVDGVRFRIPSPEHLAIHHIVHSQIHDFYRERIRPSLRNMYDMVLLQRRFGNDIDWLAIESRFRKNRQYTALALYLRDVESTLGVSGPLPIRMTRLTKLRWWRRSTFRRLPYLKFFDPLYLFMAGLKPRTPLDEVIRVPGGWRYLLKKPFTRSLYIRRLAALR